MTIELAEALWQLQKLPKDSLAALALDLMVAGLESPALVQLAGYQQGDNLNPTELFVTALSELGRLPLAHNEAVQRVALDWCQRIVTGVYSPEEGARRIWWELWIENPHLEELSFFAGAASEYPDHPDAHAEIDEEIIQYARQLLARWSHG
jgi:hypothetical protein